MRLRLIFAASLSFLVGAPMADANYLIKLKNGNQYATERYWERGPQLLFDAYGGVFGIDRSFVASIERAPQRRSIKIAGESFPETPETTEASSRTEKTSVGGKGGELGAKPQRSANDSVVTEFIRLRDRSKHVDTLLTSEILELLKQVTAFKNKLSKDSKLFIEYGREFNDAHEIGDVVESALRARRQ